MMFAPFCPTHDTNVLMTRRNVLSFWNGPAGPVIAWKCTCGHEGIMNADGSTADPIEVAAEIPAQAPVQVPVRATSGTTTMVSVDTTIDASPGVRTDAVACCA